MKSRTASWSIENIVLLGLLLLGLVILPACLQKEEACLDNRATNYDASADQACEDCCNFPSLRLEVLHRIRDTVLLNGGIYPHASPRTDSFQVNQIVFYLSELHLEWTARSEGVINTVVVDLQDGSTQTLEDNFNLVSRDNGFDYTVGDYLATGSFDRISFYVGLTEIPNQAIPGSLPDGHPLADSMYLNDQSGYIFSRISLVPDLISGDTVIYEISPSEAIKVELDFPLEIELSFDVTIPLKIDYWEWLKGIDFDAEPEVIEDSIVSNMAKAFSISE